MERLTAVGYQGHFEPNPTAAFRSCLWNHPNFQPRTNGCKFCGTFRPNMQVLLLHHFGEHNLEGQNELIFVGFNEPMGNEFELNFAGFNEPMGDEFDDILLMAWEDAP